MMPRDGYESGGAVLLWYSSSFLWIGVVFLISLLRIQIEKPLYFLSRSDGDIRPYDFAFVVLSIVLFFITRFVAGQMYLVTNDIIEQFTGAVDIAVKAFGVYLIVLFSIAILGLYVSKTKQKDEYATGFKFSLMFCGILSIIYLIIFLSA